MRIETTILNNLLQNEEYVRKVIPFIEPEYFADFIEKTIFTTIKEYIQKYNDPPVVEALLIDVQKVALTEEQYGRVKEYIDTHIKKTEVDFEWAVNETEKWCKDKAIYNAIFTGIQIIDGKTDKTPEAIPNILQDALGVSFDSHIGHDYIEQSSDRYEFYHTVEEKIPFDLDFFNKITKGGMPNKTLNICLAGTGVGKSLFMCHVAASTLLQGRNVLYITLELAD